MAGHLQVRGGVVTFLTMASILVPNPLILGFVPDSTGAFLGGGDGTGGTFWLPTDASASLPISYLSGAGHGRGGAAEPGRSM